MARKTAQMCGVDTPEITEFVKSATITKASAFRRATNDVVDFEMPPSVAHINTRVLFAAGANEHPLIIKSLTRFVKAMPFGSSVIITDEGHGWPVKKPNEFASLLMQNIEDL